MIKFYYKTIKDQEPSILGEFKIGSWIYAENPDAQEINYLVENFNLEIGLLNDALDPFEVPRLAIEKGIVYIFTRVPFKEDGKISTEPVLVALGETFVLTVSPKSLPFLEKFIKSEIRYNTTQKTKLVLQIFSEITTSFNHFLTDIGRNVRSLSVEIEKIGNKDIVRFVNSESILNDFLAALVPTNTILNNLLSANFSVKALELYDEDKDLIEDLFLSSGQLIELCKTTMKTIVNIRESSSTLMTNNLNRVMKLLTSLTIILNIPMIVAGFYSMNVRLPFSQTNRVFWGLLGISFAGSLTLLFIFIKKKWI